MKKTTRILAVLLAAILCGSSFVGCAVNEESKKTDSTEEQTSAEVSNPSNNETEPESETEEPDPFADFDYNDQSFRVYTSINNATDSLVSSNFLIEGPEEVTGEPASDAALERNLLVEELLGVKLEFTQVNQDYTGVQNDVRTYIMAGSDLYDLIINDMYGLTALTVEGMFHSADKGEYFDFTKPYWYGDFMKDIAFKEGDTFMMAGDFIIDTLRTAHCLVYNKSLYTDLYGDGEALYETVVNGEWTLDKMTELVEGAYLDLDGNGVRNIGDRFGYVSFEDWGAMIPFLITTGVQYAGRDEEGYPTITMNNERTVLMCDKMNALWTSEGLGASNIFNGNQPNALNQFSSGNALFIGYQRLGSLETDYLRSTEHEIGIVPYPKLDEQQENYITSAHDTSEIGLIPVTMPEANLSFVSAVLEVLSRESGKTVLPLYYENSLKVKYTRDTESAKMIDIIHDNIGNSFALAWHHSLSDFLNGVICSSVLTKDTFSSKYATMGKVFTKRMEMLIRSYDEKNG